MPAVSVLFSEPKIPQLRVALDVQAPPYPFQCSSASRKFLNFLTENAFAVYWRLCFSALQRAENSSMIRDYAKQYTENLSFSALQRAENSSIIRKRVTVRVALIPVSVLFSEPKIPQLLGSFHETT